MIQHFIFMKHFIYIIGITGCLTAASCTDIEPLDIQVGGVPQDMETIQAFKASEHPQTLVWFKNWKADGNMNTYLNTLPDSVDMVVVEQGYETLSQFQTTDLETAQTVKKTRVLIFAELDSWTAEYKEKIEEAEIEGENNAIEAAEAETPSREATNEEIEAAIEVERSKVNKEFTERFNALPDQLEKTVAEHNYDGVSLRITAADDAFIRERLNEIIARLGGKFGKKAGNRLLVLEGVPEYFTAYFECFDYLISTTLKTDKLSYVQQEYDKLKVYAGFDAAKMLTYLSLENDGWKTPFADLISSQPLTAPKNLTLATWLPADGKAVGGMAIRGIETDYEQNYETLRTTIQYLNLNK